MTISLKVGILGFGSRGVSFIAPVLDNNIHNRITTIIDPDISRSKYFLSECVRQGAIPADEAQAIRFIGSLDALEADEVDCLFLTASERVRAMLFEKAVRTGAHLYMEKGLSADLDGARAVLAGMQCLKPGQGVFMGFNLRHYPPLVQAKRILREGRIGKPLFVHYQELLRFQHGGSFYMRFHRDVANSGGMLVTKACHDFDLIGHLLDARPERVFSAQYKRLFGKGGPEARQQCHTCDRTLDCDFDRMRRQGNRAAMRKYARTYLDDDKVTSDGYHLDQCCWRGDTELRDLSTVLFEFGNGVPSTYSQVLFSPEGNRIVKVYGEEGSLVFDEHARAVTVLDRWNTQVDKVLTNPVADGHGGSDTGVVAAFFRMVRENELPTSTIADGVWALAAALAAYESARTEQWVPVRPIVESVGPGLT